MIVVIIQARLGSKRLPGKVLRPIAGRPMLSYVVERCLQARKPDKVVVAVPQEDLRAIEKALDVDVRLIGVNGDPNNVYARFHETLNQLSKTLMPTAFVRVCADSPMIDFTIMDWMIGQYEGGLLTNTQPRTWPPGQCMEIMETKGFLRNGDIKMNRYEKEHVLPWFYKHCKYTNVSNPLGDLSRGPSMVVDTKEDFERVGGVIEGMIRDHRTYGWQELVEMLA